MSEKNNSGKIPDDFWDIEALIPEKKSGSAYEMKRPSFDVSVTEIESLPTDEKNDRAYKGASFTRFIPPHTAKEFEGLPKPELEYELEHSLVHKVKIYSAGTKYNFYERFTDDARRLRDAEGSKCPPVPFFSYTPQYSQMNRAQLAYYLWWRGEVRRGIYHDADYSYILLYVYELINLSEETDREYTLDMMCNIWLRYGKEHAFVSKYLGEWVCDFCLIHRLPVPSEKLLPLYPDIMKNCLIKEFYVVGGEGNGVGRICADTLIEIASAYDYRKSRYATEDRLPMMKKHLVKALDAVLSSTSEENPLLDGMRNTVADNSAVRMAYSGALCSVKVRRKIEIQYYSFSRSYELRYLISDILKYSENKLRRLWGIKSRLNIYALPTHIKKCIDEYFDSVIPSAEIRSGRSAEEEKQAKEYEKLYDIPRTPLSIEHAAKIEESSWETTRILVEAFEDDEPPKIDIPVSSETKKQTEEQSDFISAIGDRLDFLLAALTENIIEQRRVSTALNTPAEALADEINEIASDLLGDVLIEENGDGFAVIEEYRELVETMRK